MNNNIQQSNINRANIANILIADDDPVFTRSVLEILAHKAMRGHLVDKFSRIIDFISKKDCDLAIISDNIKRPETDTLDYDICELVDKIRLIRPQLPVVIVSHISDTHSEDIDKNIIVKRAVEAIRLGCYDFMVKPVRPDKIETMLDSLLPNHNCSAISSEYDGPRCLYQIIGKNSKIAQAIELAIKIAPTSAPVLISGESGTGKELISGLIHYKSRRKKAPYIRINCAALSDTLLESELFGHEKGAFTGAHIQRKGRFEMAHGGTLLLDEITETPPQFQAKLLRILEQQEFERVGGNENIRVDVRIISTTNKNLLEEVRQERFRQDLYYRLCTTRINLLPLRERKDDIPELVWHFVNIYSCEVQRHITSLDSTMMRIFSEYSWPGNIRQLRNTVRTSLILGTGRSLSLADVSWLFDELQPVSQHKLTNKPIKQTPPVNQNNCNNTNDSQENISLAGLSLEEIERQAILETLQHTGGNQTKAAKVLGISDRTLRGKVHRYRKEGCLQPA